MPHNRNTAHFLPSGEIISSDHDDHFSDEKIVYFSRNNIRSESVFDCVLTLHNRNNSNYTPVIVIASLLTFQFSLNKRSESSVSNTVMQSHQAQPHVVSNIHLHLCLNCSEVQLRFLMSFGFPKTPGQRRGGRRRRLFQTRLLLVEEDFRLPCLLR